MADPKGRLVTPVAFRSDGSLHALELDDSDQLKVSVEASALPTGAATSANQTTMITALQLIDDLRTALDSVGTDELRTVPIPHGIWGVSGVTQVLESGQVIDGISTLHTVTEGSDFYLTSIYIGCLNGAAAASSAQIRIRTDAAATVIAWLINAPAGGVAHITLNFVPPIRMLSEYLIQVRSMLALVTAYGAITGYEVA